MRTVEGAGREDSEPLEFLEDVERSVHHQDPGQCMELRPIGLTTYNWSMFHALVLFIPDGRLTEVEQPQKPTKTFGLKDIWDRKVKASSNSAA